MLSRHLAQWALNPALISSAGHPLARSSIALPEQFTNPMLENISRRAYWQN